MRTEGKSPAIGRNARAPEPIRRVAWWFPDLRERERETTPATVDADDQQQRRHHLKNPDYDPPFYGWKALRFVVAHQATRKGRR